MMKMNLTAMRHALSLILTVLLLLAADIAYSQESSIPLSNVLGADGTIDLERTNSGSFDPAGYQLISAPGEEPQFALLDAGFTNDNWTSNFTIQEPNNQVKCVAMDGSGNIYIGGTFTTIGDVFATAIAMWDGSAWTPLTDATTGEEGANNQVTEITISGTDVYVGGFFTSVAGVSAQRIAKWDGSNWTALTDADTGVDGLNNSVQEIVVDGSDVYVGGNFTTAGDKTANRISRWDGTRWNSFVESGSGEIGVGSSVNAIGVIGSNVYVGGFFTTAGTVSVEKIAVWNGSTWSALTDVTTGINGIDQNSEIVYSIVPSGTDIIIGGAFRRAGGKDASNVARWDGSNWHPFTDVTTGQEGTLAEIRSISLSGSDMYVAGVFPSASGVTATNIAKWDGSNWSALPDASTGEEGVEGFVAPNSLVASGSDVYVVAPFVEVAGKSIARIAHYDGANWNALVDPTIQQLGVNGLVTAVTVVGSDIYIGGNFSTVAGVSASNIARWDGTNWSALTDATTGMEGSSFVPLAITSDGTNIYAGGQRMTSIGGVAVNNIAMWDGTNWTPLTDATSGTDGITGSNPSVFALKYENNLLYVGGFFSEAGGSTATNIAVWDGMNWSPLTDVTTGMEGTDSSVSSIMIDGTDVYFGGSFFTIGGVSANSIALWDGMNFSPFVDQTSGLNGVTGGGVSAIAIYKGDLYVGGSFSQIGGSVLATRLAVYDGTNWAPMIFGTGPNQLVSDMVVQSGGLFIAGRFAFYTGQVNGIVHWDGTELSTLGDGIDRNSSSLSRDVRSIAVMGEDLYLGGSFATAGDKNNANLAVFNSPITDADDDGLSDDDEITAGTDPNDPDSDDDNLNDGDEVALGTDPNNPDSDDDDLLDGDEVAGDPENNIDPTDPLDADSDDDNLTDGEEINTYNTDANDSDSDDDELDDGFEVNSTETDPNSNDTDDDGLTDGFEFTNANAGYNPLNDDVDDDGLTDGQETNNGNPQSIFEGQFTDDNLLSPFTADSDGDGRNDGDEVNGHVDGVNPEAESNPAVEPDDVNPSLQSDPTNADTDDDDLDDGAEVQLGTDLVDTDSDDDGLTDGREANSALPNFTGTDPTDADSDDDTISDGDEINGDPATDPNQADTDNDGLDDNDEDETEPTNDDRDNDGLLDGEELNGGVWDKELRDFTGPLLASGLANESLLDPDDPDSDADGCNDGDEISKGTDPTDMEEGGPVTFYADEDGDGFGDAENSTTQCLQPVGFVTDNTDCDDDDADVFPGAPAKADGKDNDCDGTVDKVAQEITFAALPDITFSDAVVTLVASASSELTVTFEVSGPATLNGATLTLTGAGSVTVVASQAGNDAYLAAENLSRTFCVNPTLTQTENVLSTTNQTGNTWFLDGEEITGQEGGTINITESGTYRVEASGGCVSADFEATFTAVPTGILDELQEQLKVYPNPVVNTLNFTIGTELNRDITIELYDFLGQRYDAKHITRTDFSGEITFDVSALNRGVYLYKITTADEFVSGKFIKN